MPKLEFQTIIDYTICGIPCQIGVVSYTCVLAFNGPATLCWSRDDYYGYTDMEWQVLDRKGYPAPWLSRKLTRSMEQDIESAIEDFYSDRDYDYYD